MSTSHPIRSPLHLAYPLPGPSIPTNDPQQLPNQHQEQQQRTPGSDQSYEDDHGAHPDSNTDLIQTLSNVPRALDMGMHGLAAFLSIYGTYSIISTMHFQSQHGYTSATALFLFLVLGLSLVLALMYTILAWWHRTTEGRNRIKIYHERQEASSADEGILKQEGSSSSWTTWRTRLRTWVIRASLFSISPCPRLWILVGLALSTLLAASLQWYKIRNGSSCDAIAPMYRHFCQTTKAAVVVTYLTAVVWMTCFGFWVYKTRQYVNLSAIFQNRKEMILKKRKTSQMERRSDIMIAMPEDGSTVESSVQVYPHSHNEPHGLEQQDVDDATKTRRGQKSSGLRLTVPEMGERGADSMGSISNISGSNISGSNVSGSSSLGLGIEICTKSFMEGSDLLFASPDKEAGVVDCTTSTTQGDGMGKSEDMSNNGTSIAKLDHVDVVSSQSIGATISLAGLGSSRAESSNAILSSKGDSVNSIQAESTNSRSNTSDFVTEVGRSSPSNSTVTSTVPGRDVGTSRGESEEDFAAMERSRSERLRDHAKIFRPARSSSTNLQEAYSNRGTPILHSSGSSVREMMAVPCSPSPSLIRMMRSNSAPFSAHSLPPMTPTTPVLSRGGMGYMGKETMKALNTLPRSSSTGYISGFNNLNATSSGTPSVQASPMMGMYTPAMDFNVVGTPCSMSSYRSMSSFFGPGLQPAGGFGSPFYSQSQAEAFASEQSMDEHLKAIRRRSYAAEITKTPTAGVRASFELANSKTPDPTSASSTPFVSGSPSVTPSSSSGGFRMSFYSPNLASFRRRSSLGLKSVLTSIVSSPAAQSISSSFSASSSSSSPGSSPRSPSWPNSQLNSSSIRSPHGSTQGISSSSSFTMQRKKEQTVSAQELLRAEYGDLFPTQPQSNSVQQLNNMQAKLEPYPEPGIRTPEVRSSASSPLGGSSLLSRPRSASTSSTRSAHSTLTTQTHSSATSDSNTSTASTLTSLSNEEKQGPSSTSKKSVSSSEHKNTGSVLPPSFFNRILIGHQHHSSLKGNNQYQKQQHHHHHPHQQQQYQLNARDLLRKGSRGKSVGQGGPNGFRPKKTVRGVKSENSTPTTAKKFPAHGDLSQYCWDYRKQMPVD
ncbi:hypothetical protein BGX28_000721 [Mortierella sp. GBA30]|nr:hypothetical protein BGX28_000721 [Mortierella sp. GBA30]